MSISTVVGHAEGRKGMTLGVYSGGPSLDQLRTCVRGSSTVAIRSSGRVWVATR
jgi:hypothetical protein